MVNINKRNQNETKYNIIVLICSFLIVGTTKNTQAASAPLEIKMVDVVRRIAPHIQHYYIADIISRITGREPSQIDLFCRELRKICTLNMYINSMIISINQEEDLEVLRNIAENNNNILSIINNLNPSNSSMTILDIYPDLRDDEIIRHNKHGSDQINLLIELYGNSALISNIASEIESILKSDPEKNTDEQSDLSQLEQLIKDNNVNLGIISDAIKEEHIYRTHDCPIKCLIKKTNCRGLLLNLMKKDKTEGDEEDK